MVAAASFFIERKNMLLHQTHSKEKIELRLKALPRIYRNYCVAATHTIVQLRFNSQKPRSRIPQLQDVALANNVLTSHSLIDDLMRVLPESFRN